MKSVRVEVGGVDWTELRVQKRELSEIIKRRRKPWPDLLEGLLNLLDSIQDQAAEQLGKDVVFGRQHE